MRKEIVVGNNLTVVQDILLKAMDEIHRICEDSGIVYYLIGGSALGAVRHEGFIPWDVDIDLDALSPLLTEYNCQYLILNKSVPYTGDPQKNGLTKIADIEAYELYRNEAVEIAKKKAS